MKCEVQELSSQEVRRFEIPNLALSVIPGRNTKVLIFRTDRSDLPHLTLSWGNASGEIDFHLTTRLAGGEEHHISITKVPESELIQAVEMFKVELAEAFAAQMPRLQRVRPEWLGRRGYLVVHLTSEGGDTANAPLNPRFSISS